MLHTPSPSPGGGDRPEAANLITADDLVAVTTLSVSVPAATAIQLLDGFLGNQLADCLAATPISTRLADDAAAGLIAKDGPAQQPRRLLMDCHGVSWVTTSKILARKRPHLLPVYDNVVACAIKHPIDDLWGHLREALRADDKALDARLTELRLAAGLNPRISALRVLDVALWMRHHDAHTRQRCDSVA